MATVTKPSKVSVSNIGPISSIEFDLPEGQGGVRVLKGTSGSGKTTAIRALSGLLGSKDDLSDLVPSDEHDKGEVIGMGRKVNVGKRVTSSGASTVPTLGAKLDMGLLVDPRVSDPKARTKVRIRTLASAGGMRLSPEELLGEKVEEYSEYIDLDEAARCDDPVQMADMMKRALDSAAKEQERQSEVQLGLSKAKAIEAGDMDELNAAGNPDELAAKHRQAMQAAAAIEQELGADKTALEHNAKLDSQIAELQSKVAGDSLEAIQAKIESQQKLVDGLQQRLDAAKAGLQALRNDLKSAQDRQQQLQRLEGNRMAVKGRYTSVDLEAAREAEQVAYTNLVAIQSIARRQQALKDSDLYRAEADELAAIAEKLRAAAQRVQAEVQKALPAGPIEIHDGELMVKHAKRKKLVPYDELSDGERWSIAMQYAINAVGEGGVVPLKQESWQALAPELKKQIAEQCEKAKVWLISAEVAEGPLRVEEFAK